MNNITVEEFKKLLAQGAVRKLVDVRTPAEFEEQHVTGAVNIPLGKIKNADLASNGEIIYLLCRSGTRAKQAQQDLLTRGVNDTVCVEGGTVAAQAAGIPIVQGTRKSMSLERQVRICAGSLIVLGSILSLFVSGYFLIVPAFVGGGLIFSGVTDWCGMALVLEKMPWNKASAPEKGACHV